MAVFRVHKNKDNPYLMINKYHIYDQRLSWKAKGILSYFLSRPDDWQFYREEILTHATDGKDSLNKGIDELIKCGYMKREMKRNENGKFTGGYSYEIFETPLDLAEYENACTDNLPKAEKPTSGKPISEKPTSENPPLLNNDIKLNNEFKSSSSNSNVEVFKHFEKCNFGLISPMLMEKISADIEIYSKEWVMKAAEVSDESGKHNYNYVKGILENWKANGGIKEKKEVKSNATGSNFKKNTGESKGKWTGYKPSAPKIAGETDTTGLI